MSTMTILTAANPMFSSTSNKDVDVESASLPSDSGNTPKLGQSTKPSKTSSSASPRNLKKLVYVEFFLLFLCIAFAAVMIAATVQLLYITPFEPVFWLFIFSMIIYWLVSFGLVFLWMYVNKIRNEEEGTKTCSSKGCMRNVKRVPFWIFIASLICSFACMLLLLRFVLPEAFFPSTNLRLQRLGAVTADSASFFIRDPTLGENAQVQVQYRINGTTDPFSFSTEKAVLSVDNDYSAFMRLTGLAPSTAYEWKFANMTQTFSFKTNPVAGQPSKFSFYFGSCFLHNFPNFEEAPGFGYALDILKPDLFMFIGDFIYSDIPFFRNDDVETYHSLYRNTLKNSHVQRALQRIPNYNMWDDHEIRNNYPDVVGSNIRQGRGNFENSINRSWQLYLGAGNPVTQPGKFYFDFDYGDSSFIFLDTRGGRTPHYAADAVNVTFLGQAQKEYFKSWLVAKNTTAKFKFVLSPVGVTNDFPSAEDSWGGYKFERDEILEFIRENHIEGVVWLSGDSHFAYALELGGAPGGMGGGFYEFSASPISAFDFTLGGFIAETEPFKPEAQREDRIIWNTIGRKGAMSLLGLVRVDTTLAMPEIAVEFYDSETKIYEMKLQLQQLRPWESP